MRLPVPAVLTKRCRIRIDESNQYLCHNPATNWTKTVTSGTRVGFAEDVVPQRSLALPPRRGDADLLRGERRDSNVMGHGLAKRGASAHAIDAVGTLLFVAVGLVGCGGPVLLERFTGWPSAYTTLAAVFVLLGPIALVVAKHTRDAIRRNRSA